VSTDKWLPTELSSVSSIKNPLPYDTPMKEDCETLKALIQLDAAEASTNARLCMTEKDDADQSQA
jgi:hypothetical protein